MAKGPKGFSGAEKDELRNKLCKECERSWDAHGYKKTSVGELTAKIGISTGAFYLLYATKEDLFCDTLQRVQGRLKNGVKEIIASEKGKPGFIKMMKWHFLEYDKSRFLYDWEAPDFLSFLNKIPKERVEKLQFDSACFFEETIKAAGISLKTDVKTANAVISALLYTVKLKDRLAGAHFEVFELLLNGVIDELFE